VTELFDLPVEVRVGGGGRIEAVRLPEGWRVVTRTVNRWLVEIDWWRDPVRRDYRRCLVRSGDCVELYHDLETGAWHLARRYD
jgi:hypothetical protein